MNLSASLRLCVKLLGLVSLLLAPCSLLSQQTTVLFDAADNTLKRPTAAQFAAANLASIYQPLDADLTSWAAVTRASGFDTFTATPSGANLANLLTTALPASKGGTGLTALSANVVSLLGAADYSAMRTQLGLVIGTNVQAWDADLDSIAGNTTGGFLTRTASNTYTPRTITGTAGQITVTNGDGVSGAPTISLPSTITQATTFSAGVITQSSGGLQMKSTSDGSALLSTYDFAGTNRFQINQANSGSLGFFGSVTTFTKVAELTDAAIASGKFSVLYTTPSTGTASGAFQTSGGAGIAGNVVLGGVLGVGAYSGSRKVNVSGDSASFDLFAATDTNAGTARTWLFGPQTGVSNSFTFRDGTSSVNVLSLYDGASGSFPYQVRAIGTTEGAGAALRSMGGIYAAKSIVSAGATGGIGYATGAGGAQTQGTSRTTGVTLNTVTGAITLFTAAGSTTATSFTVTNSAVSATDTIVLSVKSSTNKYLCFVTAVASGSFEITFYTTGGTSSDAPVINFAVIKAVAS